MLTAIKQLIDSDIPNWRRTLAWVFFTALVIRVGFILTLQDGFYFPDSVSYSTAAHNLLDKGELVTAYDRPPGYPVFIAGVYALFGQSIRAIRIVEAVMGALLAVVIALLASRIGGRLVGAIAGVMWGMYPIAVF